MNPYAIAACGTSRAGKRQLGRGSLPSACPAPGVAADETRDTGGAELSPRETDILRELALGKSNKEISSSLMISVETVKFHLKNIQAKLGVSNRLSAVLKGIRTGIIGMPDSLA